MGRFPSEENGNSSWSGLTQDTDRFFAQSGRCGQDAPSRNTLPHSAPHPFDKEVTFAAPFPARLDPCDTDARRQLPMTGDPFVSIAVPGPITGNPNVPGRWTFALD